MCILMLTIRTWMAIMIWMNLKISWNIMIFIFEWNMIKYLINYKPNASICVIWISAIISWISIKKALTLTIRNSLWPIFPRFLKMLNSLLMWIYLEWIFKKSKFCKLWNWRRMLHTSYRFIWVITVSYVVTKD